MKTHHKLTRSASTAIAAVLALASTTAMAQVIDPVVVPAPATSPSSAPASPAPVLQSPVGPAAQANAPTASTTLGGPAVTSTAPTATPTVSRPVVQATSPETSTVAGAPGANTSESTTPRAAASAAPASAGRSPAAAPRTVAARGPDNPAASAEVPVVVAPVSGAAEGAAPAAPVVPVIAADTDSGVVADSPGSDASETAMWLGGLLSILALAGLGGVAAVAMRRRRKVEAVRLERPKLDPVTGKPLSAPSITAPVAAATVTSSIPASRHFGSPISQLHQPAASDARGLSHSGAAVSLPRERLATPEERRALINRMVDAEPDRANPFRSRKARLHRAKLIEQSIGRRFPGGKSRIDLSQYPMNWPELAQGRSAAA
jgi:hypothetical protein